MEEGGFGPRQGGAQGDRTPEALRVRRCVRLLALLVDEALLDANPLFARLNSGLPEVATKATSTSDSTRADQSSLVALYA